MPLEMAKHVDHGFFDFAGIELVSAAHLVKKLCNLLWGIAGQGLHLFLVDEVPYLFDHFVF